MAKSPVVPSASTSDRRPGWRPDIPDQRDHAYEARPALLAKRPSRVDLRPACPPVLEQGDLGTCTACALASAHRYCQRKQPGGDEFDPSRLFLYWNARALDGTTASDAGGTFRNGFKTLAAQGVCPESVWPYDPRKVARKPPVGAFREAMRHQALRYRRVARSADQLESCLASGFPFVFGVSLYDSFHWDRVAVSGVVPMPRGSERCRGGHALMAVGYDRRREVFAVQNCWGTDWGDDGFCTLPYDYLLSSKLSGDFWTLRLVEE